MRAPFTLLTACAVLLTVPAAAQLLPGVGVPQLPVVGPVAQGLEQTLDRPLQDIRQTAQQLVEARADRIADLLRRQSEFVEPDANGEPAVRGELLLVDADAATLGAVRAAGFREAGSEQLGSLGISVTRLQVPRGASLGEAQRHLLRVAPAAEIAPDNLHFQSGGTATLEVAAAAAVAPATIATPVGVIDGAPGKGQQVAALRGFAKGAPLASNHGSAVVSLLQGAGARRVLAADVYGSDPAGGNALAIVRALDWLAGAGARVVSISLVGPRNAVLEKALGALQRKGMIVVAAVGNDGPAAPPSYPASYPGVLAVTGVDRRQRPLIEAGRALHLDYAAPGADIRGRDKAGKWASLRGTSFAVPLVAARAAAALARGGSWRAALDREAVDLGPQGPDGQFGRGLLCRECARR
uniref:S8 family serine peptidase n=1 Tax=Altererythrobacter segetis TaxID=1104773 RepID=UPI00140A5EC1|nr:S8 family serine peptidase [Altererythrobacter segetis]